MPLEFEGVAPAGGKTAWLWAWLFNTTTSFTIAEVGVFNAASSGTMLARRVLPNSVVTSTSKAYRIEVEVAVRDL